MHCLDKGGLHQRRANQADLIKVFFFFFNHELLGTNIDVTQVRSYDNLRDLFIKSLPTARHRQLVQGIGMRRFSSLLDM